MSEQPIVEKKKIVKATLFALTLGSIILISAVLPAEYGIDPTGAGKLLGFSKLHTVAKPVAKTPTKTKKRKLIKLENAGSGPKIPRPEEAASPAPDTQFPEREDSIQVTVPANKGIEYKVDMLKYGTMTYEWSSEYTTLYFDFHGEVKQAKKVKPEDVFFESYTIAYADNMVGTFLSPFEGKHGWYFRNKTNKDVIVTIRLKGQYKLRKKP